MAKRIVMGVHVSNRVVEVPKVQQLLTDYGCIIKTRLGLHEAGNSTCSSKGLLLLELMDDDNAVGELESKLNAITGVDAKSMIFPE